VGSRRQRVHRGPSDCPVALSFLFRQTAETVGYCQLVNSSGKRRYQTFSLVGGFFFSMSSNNELNSFTQFESFTMLTMTANSAAKVVHGGLRVISINFPS
jgi:hypothetical protein